MKKAVLTAALSLAAISAFAGEKKVEFPEDYRGWTHVKSMVIEKDHALANPFAGIHHIYANKKAVKGYKKSNFPDGSVIVFDLLSHVEGGSAITEGDRKLIGVMKKDSKNFASTGGWAFEAFAKDSKSERIVGDGGVSCFGCHAAQKENDFVFSGYRK